VSTGGANPAADPAAQNEAVHVSRRESSDPEKQSALSPTSGRAEAPDTAVRGLLARGLFGKKRGRGAPPLRDRLREVVERDRALAGAESGDSQPGWPDPEASDHGLSGPASGTRARPADVHEADGLRAPRHDVLDDLLELQEEYDRGRRESHAPPARARSVESALPTSLLADWIAAEIAELPDASAPLDLSEAGELQHNARSDAEDVSEAELAPAARYDAPEQATEVELVLPVPYDADDAHDTEQPLEALVSPVPHDADDTPARAELATHIELVLPVPYDADDAYAAETADEADADVELLLSVPRGVRPMLAPEAAQDTASFLAEQTVEPGEAAASRSSADVASVSERGAEPIEQERAESLSIELASEDVTVSTPAHDPAESEPESEAPSLSREPIQTRTMARLLAGHGYRARALSIYDELLRKNPDQPELRAEAEALRKP
jgi:hypothetical protein